MARQESYDGTTFVENSIPFIQKFGYQDLNARSLCNFVGCSTQPLFKNYKNMDDFKVELEKRLVEYYHSFIEKIINEDEYLVTSAYAKVMFAKREPNLYKTLFIYNMLSNKSSKTLKRIENGEKAIKIVSKKYNINETEAKELYDAVKFYTSGVAEEVLCNNKLMNSMDLYLLIERAVNRLADGRML